MLALGILLAVRAESVTQLVLGSVKLIGLARGRVLAGRGLAARQRGRSLGQLSRAACGVWAVMSANLPRLTDPGRRPVADASSSLRAAGALGSAGLERARSDHHHAGGGVRADDRWSAWSRGLATWPRSGRFTPACTRRSARKTRFAGTILPMTCPNRPRSGMDGVALDYRKSSRFAYRGFKSFGLEIPRMTWFDWGGFLAAWVLVGGLIGLLIWLAGLGSR